MEGIYGNITYGDNMEIKEATVEDMDKVYELSCEMVAGSSLDMATPSLNKIRGLLANVNTSFFIGYYDAIPAGFIGINIGTFYFSDVRRASDLGLYVSPKYRGGSMAKRLLQRAENWAREKGVKAIFMGQTVGNKKDSTLNFYLRNGYELCGFNTIKRI